MTYFSQIYHTGSNYFNNQYCNSHEKTLALAICIRAIVYTNCDYSFNQCGIFEKMVSFTQIPSLNQGLEQGKLLAAVISQIKVQKT